MPLILWFGARRACVVGGLILTACVASGACEAPEVSNRPRSSSQTTLVGENWAPRDAVFILVADDADTVEAAALRARTLDSLRGALLEYVEQSEACGTPDPAAWHPADLRVVVVRPSAPDAEAALGPAQDPGLELDTHTFSTETVDSLVGAVALALEDRLAEPGEPYRPLRAAQRSLNLLAGARPPDGAADESLLDVLRDPETPVHLLVASAREDEDPSGVPELVPTNTALSLTFARAVVAPSSEGDATCALAPAPGSRIQRWAEATASDLWAWPCDAANTWGSMLIDLYADCSPRCIGAPMDIDQSGAASCVATVDQRELDRCDPALGRRDPAGGPTIVERDGETLRRCEVVQLTGEDLQACRTSLDCPGCAPGFCATDVPELSEACAQVDATALRFIGGAAFDGSSAVTVTCVREGE